MILCFCNYIRKDMDRTGLKLKYNNSNKSLLCSSLFYVVIKIM